jgi:hypothetical protein
MRQPPGPGPGFACASGDCTMIIEGRLDAGDALADAGISATCLG